MREVIISVTCDICTDVFTERDEGSNRVLFTVYGEQREMDICDPCIGDSFLPGGRPVGKAKKSGTPFACTFCSKSFASQRGLSAHQTRTHTP